MDKVGVMLSLILFFSIVFAEGSSKKRKDNDDVSVIMTELENLKSIQSEFIVRLAEIDDLKTSLGFLEAKVHGIEKENRQLKERIKKLESSNSERIYEASVPSPDNVHRIQEDTNRSLSHDTEANVSEFQQRIQKRQVPADGRVAFTAGVSVPDLVNLGDHHTVIFDRAITNIGNAYHTHTGIFVAPRKGAYVFTLTIMVKAGHQQYLEIVLDGNAINDIVSNALSEGDFMTTTKQWILEVNQGSEVWIRTAGAGQLHGYMHSLFSGFLLFETE